MSDAKLALVLVNRPVPEPDLAIHEAVPVHRHEATVLQRLQFGSELVERRRAPVNFQKGILLVLVALHDEDFKRVFVGQKDLIRDGLRLRRLDVLAERRDVPLERLEVLRRRERQRHEQREGWRRGRRRSAGGHDEGYAARYRKSNAEGNVDEGVSATRSGRKRWPAEGHARGGTGEEEDKVGANSRLIIFNLFICG